MLIFVLALIAVVIGIILIEVPALVKNKLWGELTAFSFLLVVGFVLSLLQIIGVRIPSPNKGIEILIENIKNVFTQ